MASTSVEDTGGNDISLILSSIGLGNLLEKFREERVDIKVVNELSDKELHRREVCKNEETAITSPSSTSTSRIGTPISLVNEERLALFRPKGHGSSKCVKRRRGGANNIEPKRPWTAQFMCLADKLSTKVPTALEKQILFNKSWSRVQENQVRYE